MKKIQKTSVNDNYFDVIDDECKAYFLGLLMADGCNYEDIGNIKIDLIERDCHIIEKLREVTGFNGSIRHYPAQRKIINGDYYDCQPYCRIVIHSKHMSEVLASYGMVANKSTYGMMLPEGIVPDTLFHHLMRGYIDGNGGLAYWEDNHETQHNKFQINCCGYDEIIKFIADYFANKFDCKPQIASRYPERDNHNLQMNICGNLKVKAITDWLYKDATVYLQRKYDKYVILCETVARVQNNKTLYGSMHPRRPVIYVPTQEIFESVSAAAKSINKTSSYITLSAQGHRNGWEYCDEYIKAAV